MKTKIVDIIEIDHGKPMVSSLTISKEFGRTHKRVVSSIERLISKGTLGTGAVLSSWIDSTGRSNKMYLLDERSSLIAMPFIGGAKAEEGQAKLVDAYLFYRKNFSNPPRKSIIEEKRHAHHPMMNALIEFREEQGKDTRSVHYISENKLCNFVIAGKFETIDETTLSNENLKLLGEVRRRNESYLMAGLDYPDRKQRLIQFVIKTRTKAIA